MGTRRPFFGLAKACVLICVLLMLMVLPVPGHTEPMNEAITIWSDGVRLAGNLWKPDGLGKDERRPAILMVHGWGGEKAHLNQSYAPQFAELGYVVLTFDYRGWGESEGKLIRVGDRPAGVSPDTPDFSVAVREVRLVVDPLDQLEDIRAAHAYLIADKQVDPTLLAIWGSSLGGGLALQSAATLEGFTVLISQIGAVNPQASGTGTSTEIARLRSAVARGEAPPFPGKESAVPGLTGYLDRHRYARYNPFATADQLNAATLIIDAADEELFDTSKNGAALHARIKNRLVTRYHKLEGKHYDLYVGAGYERALKLEKAWLVDHLPVGE